MKWWARFLIVGLIYAILFDLLLGFVLVMIVEKYIGYTTVLEALQHSCALALGLLLSYKMYPPGYKGKDKEEEQ